VVCVVAPPHAHARGSVQAEELPSPPERFEAADRFGTLPPLRAPGHPTLYVELPSIVGGELAADEFSHVRVEQLRGQALSAVRAAITSGALKPGKHLVETELSDMLQISRGTLREALRQLEQEGLLSAGPRGRLSVRHLDEKEIRDIFSVRAALESLAAGTLCELPNKHHATEALHKAIDAMTATANGTLEERIESDLEFHRTLCRLTGNETLLHSWESLEGSIRMSVMFAGREKGVSNMSVDRHREIVDAIDTGDAALARETIGRHMDNAADNLVA